MDQRKFLFCKQGEMLLMRVVTTHEVSVTMANGSLGSLGVMGHGDPGIVTSLGPGETGAWGGEKVTPGQ